MRRSRWILSSIIDSRAGNSVVIQRLSISTVDQQNLKTGRRQHPGGLSFGVGRASYGNDHRGAIDDGYRGIQSLDGELRDWVWVVVVDKRQANDVLLLIIPIKAFSSIHLAQSATSCLR